MAVAVLRWPEREADRQRCAAAAVPRLLLVTEGSTPPSRWDDDEDWIRLPAPEADVDARIRALAMRHAERTSAPPSMDDDGVLRFAGRSVALPPVQARLAAALIDAFGNVVGRAELAAAGWCRAPQRDNVLDVHMNRLRRRLSSLGLAIRTHRLRGYGLELADIDSVLMG